MLSKLIALHVCLLMVVCTAQGMLPSATAASAQDKTAKTDQLTVKAALEKIELLLKEYKNCLTQAKAAINPEEGKSFIDQAKRAISQIQEIASSTNRDENFKTPAERIAYLDQLIDQLIKVYTESEELNIKETDEMLAFLYFEKYEICADTAEKEACLEQALMISADIAEKEGCLQEALVRGLQVQVVSRDANDKTKDEDLASFYFFMAGIFRQKSKLERDARQRRLFKRQSSQWNLKAAEKGHVTAQYFEGVKYFNKRPNASPAERLELEDKAIKWFEKAAAQGHADSQYEFGRGLYTLSERVADEKKGDLVLRAVNNFFEASRQGHAEAKASLKRTLELYEIEISVASAALLGYSSAQFFTGVVYLNKAEQAAIPAEREKFLEKAIEWLDKSACQNYCSAQNALGEIFYEKAKTESQVILKWDWVHKATKWFFVAEKGGHPRARKNLDTAIREHSLQLTADDNFLRINSTSDSHTEYIVQLNRKAQLADYLGARVKAATKEFESLKTSEPNVVTVEKICAKCSKPAGNICGRCKKVPYCSVNCQTEDWAKHKQECKSPDQPHV